MLHTLDIDGVLFNTPAELFDEWRLIFDIAPWAEEHAEYLHGINTAVTARDGRRAAEFMPFCAPPEPKMSDAAIWKVIESLPGVIITYGDGKEP